MIKFLKKFKEKILIALACSFIGIGTILTNTLETKAYTSDTFTHTLTTELHNNITYYKVDSNFVYTRYNFLLINFTSSVSGNWTMDLNLYDSNYSLLRYNRLTAYNVSNGVSFYYFVENLSSAYCFNVVSGATNFTIINLDYVNSNDLSTSYYAQTYIDNYTNLQSQYDSLLLDYQNYTSNHSYTNEQYNFLMTQNATLTQQVQALQSQYDTYVSLHSYTNIQYETLLNNYNNLNQIYSDLQLSYTTLQSQYNLLANGQLGYLDYMEFYINNQSIEFGNDSDTELNLNELIDYNLYANNSLNLSYFTIQQVNPNYYPLKIVSYYNNLPVNLLSMYFNGGTVGIIKFGYYADSSYLLKQISFDNTGTAVDSINSSLINYDVFKGLNVEYIEYIEIQFNNADSIAGSINFNSTYNIAYSNGFSNGYNYGYNVSNGVNSEKINNARQEGYQNGYDVGKQDGIAIGSDENNSLYGVVIRTL